MGISQNAFSELRNILADDGFSNVTLTSPIRETGHLDFKLANLPTNIEGTEVASWLDILKEANTHVLEYCQNNELTITFNPVDYAFYIRPQK